MPCYIYVYISCAICSAGACRERIFSILIQSFARNLCFVPCLELFCFQANLIGLTLIRGASSTQAGTGRHRGGGGGGSTDTYAPAPAPAVRWAPVRPVPELVFRYTFIFVSSFLDWT